MNVRPSRPALLAAVVAIGALALLAASLPALGRNAPTLADPTAVPAATEAPAGGTVGEKPGKGPKADPPGRGRAGTKPAERPVTLTGRVAMRTDADGATGYTLTVDGTTYQLDAGPPWWWGDDHPLAGHVGDVATIEGDQADGTNRIDVLAIDGDAIREPGKPAWAGGPKAVGEAHPGWKGWSMGGGASNGSGSGARPGGGRPPWAGPMRPENP